MRRYMHMDPNHPRLVLQDTSFYISNTPASPSVRRTLVNPAVYTVLLRQYLRDDVLKYCTFWHSRGSIIHHRHILWVFRSLPANLGAKDKEIAR